MYGTRISRRLLVLFILLGLVIVRSPNISAQDELDEGDNPNHEFRYEVTDDDDTIPEREFDIAKPDPLSAVRKSWKLTPVIQLDGENEHLVRSIIDENGGTTPETAAFIVLFVTNSEGCARLSNIYSLVAKSYWDDLERRRSVSTSKVYFFAANATRNSKIFKDFGVTKVPTVVFIPPGSKYGDLEDENIIDPAIQADLHEMTQWLGVKSKLTIPVAGASTALMGGLASSIESWGVYLIALQVLFLFGSNIYRFTSKIGWMMLSFLVYFFSVSGCIFCFLRGAPPFGYSEQYGLMFLYPDRSGQFFFEGIMIGIINTGISMAFVFAGEMMIGVDIVNDLEAWLDPQAEEERRSRQPERREQKIQRLFKSASICLTLAAFLTLNMFVLFKRKSPWYQPFRML